MVGCDEPFKVFSLNLYRFLDNLMKDWSIPDNLIEKKFVSPKELAEILGISLPTAYRLIGERTLPAFKVRKSLRVLRDDVIEYLKSQRLDPF